MQVAFKLLFFFFNLFWFQSLVRQNFFECACKLLFFYFNLFWFQSLVRQKFFRKIYIDGIIKLMDMSLRQFWEKVQFSHSVMSNSLRPHGLQHSRLPCPSPTPGAYSNSGPSSQWWHPIITSSVVPFSSHLQSFPASGSFPMNQFFTSGGQSIGVSASASVLPMNIWDWFPSGLTGLISLKSKELLRVFSNTTVQKLQFFSTQLSL